MLYSIIAETPQWKSENINQLMDHLHPFAIAMLNYRRVTNITFNFPIRHHSSSHHLQDWQMTAVPLGAWYKATPMVETTSLPEPHGKFGDWLIGWLVGYISYVVTFVDSCHLILLKTMKVHTEIVPSGIQPQQWVYPLVNKHSY